MLTDSKSQASRVTWGKLEWPAPALSRAGSVTVAPDGLKVSLLFDDFEAALEGSCKNLATTRTVGVRLPVRVDDELNVFGFFQELRGNVSKSPGARALVVLECLGACKVLDYPFDDPYDAAGAGNAEESTGSVGGRDESISAQLMTVLRRPAKSRGGPFVQIPEYFATLFAVVERRTPDDFVRLSIDSLDMEIKIDG